MKLERDEYKKMLSERFANSLGWDADQSIHVAGIAIDALCVLHGGEQIYIPKRIIEKGKIAEDYNRGKTISQLARKYGLTSVTIRKTIKDLL